MSPYIYPIMLMGMLLGTTATMISSHWLLAWMGLELSTIAIIPIMAHLHHPRAVEATTKYFLVQAAAAALLLFASVTNAWLCGEWFIQQMTHPLPTTMIILALAMKLGLAPLHAWLPEVLQGLDLMTGMILSTWQKLAPMALLIQIQPQDPTIFIVLGLASTLIGGWGGLNQTQLRKILAYSSIAHLGWMILIIQFAPSLTLLSLLMYFIMTISSFTIFKHLSSTSIPSLATSWSKAPALTALAPFTLLSLGGLPPLSGFAPKWMILQELTKQQLPLIATVAALSALLSLYFYLRLTYSMSLTISPNTTLNSAPWRLLRQHNTLHIALPTTMTILLLPLTPAALTLLS
ncbi:NADH dehydrogenase subunit 2 (mitochondrion) [Salarias fasciatus]|uniref:NADH-ubiquinone oxidoreductase chain 2 n=1 Tax=Salarias fasciatus TaxID=181472 RepID=Q8HKT6_SALFA|nr:NADH dehydrogenase subunit 2 [Salarias fasciatus]BAC23762.1 NADH dehydrogenase subunit 2 [Salarias fasciatus]